jgi:hypothetical protein
VPPEPVVPVLALLAVVVVPVAPVMPLLAIVVPGPVVLLLAEVPLPDVVDASGVFRADVATEPPQATAHAPTTHAREAAFVDRDKKAKGIARNLRATHMPCAARVTADDRAKPTVPDCANERRSCQGPSRPAGIGGSH